MISHTHTPNYRRRRTLGLLALVAVGGLIGYGVTALRSTGTDTDLSPGPIAEGEASAGRSELLPSLTAQRRRSAVRFAARRRGLVSYAVIDAAGRLACYRCRASYPSASVSKAMLLVAYLHRLAAEQQELSARHEAQLDSMIRLSDNAAANAIYTHVGHRRLHQLAKDVGMTDFAVSNSWARARITALDQARFFSRIEAVLAPEYTTYARTLLSSIVQSQAWGIPEVVTPTRQIIFKGGWLITKRGSLVHQVARIEAGASSLAVAVLTDGNPHDAYGRETIRGIASRLFASTG